MLRIDYTLIIQIANFLVLLFLLNIILYKPIRLILTHRKEEINDFEITIRDSRDRFSLLADELEQSMAAAREQGFKEKKESKNEGLDEENRLVQNAIDAVGEKIERAREDIGRNMEGLRQSLDKEVSLFSRELAEKVLGRSI